MKKIHLPFALCFALLSLGSLQAQPTQDLSEKLIGQWTGTGSLFGQEAGFTMHWERQLNGKFLKLEFENAFADQTGTERKMQANAYYNFTENKGYWFDSRGMMLPLSLEVNENELTVLWGDDATERGKTVYTVLNDKEIHVTDFVMREDAYIQFGEAQYQKSKD